MYAYKKNIDEEDDISDEGDEINVEAAAAMEIEDETETVRIPMIKFGKF